MSKLHKAQNPVILVGGGTVMSEGGVEAARALAEHLNAPANLVVTSLDGLLRESSSEVMLAPLFR